MFEKIQSYLANQLDISPDDITRDTTFESLGDRKSVGRERV